ncbi:MAG: AIR synthase family protein [Anaerovoracaceae bacterium]
MKIGKLDNETLERLIINKIRYRRPEVKKSAAVGEDCAVIDFGEYNCVISTDPITGAVSDIGRLAVNVSCNDIASNGVEPLGILLTVLLPPSVTEEQMEQIMEDAAREAEKLQVEILGGHTEITPAVTVPVISATALGRQPAAAAVDRRIQPGDRFVITKAAGIEGTGIIVSDYGEELGEVLTEEEAAFGRELLARTSVVREGVIAGRLGIGPMHDVTEGGILGAVWELCRGSGVDARLDMEKIPLYEVTRKVCSHYGLNPYRLISSGCMLMAVEPDRLEALMEQLKAAGIPAADIGTAVEKGCGMEIEAPSADELFKVVHRKKEQEGA